MFSKLKVSNSILGSETATEGTDRDVGGNLPEVTLRVRPEARKKSKLVGDELVSVEVERVRVEHEVVDHHVLVLQVGLGQLVDLLRPHRRPVPLASRIGHRDGDARKLSAENPAHAAGNDSGNPELLRVGQQRRVL